MNEPLISVIVPIYNVEKYLRQCVDSIINQTYENLEIILVDDGSPDNCGSICDEYAKKDSRIIVIHKENGGLSSARNAGLDVYKGDYISFIDSDDEIHPQYFETLIYFANKFNADIVQSNIVPNTVFKEKIEDYNTLNYTIVNRKQAEIILANKISNYVSACNKLFSKKSISDHRFPINRINEDVYTTYKYIWSIGDKGNVIFLDIVLYQYNVRNNSIMHSNYNLKRLDELDGWKLAIDFFYDLEIKDNYLMTYQERLKYHWNMLRKSNCEIKKEKMRDLINTSRNIFPRIIRIRKMTLNKKISAFIFDYFTIIYRLFVDFSLWKNRRGT